MLVARCLLLTALLCATQTWAQTVQIDETAGPLQAKPGCSGATLEVCELRIYQVMVESFVDGDPAHDYGDGYGPSHHRGDLRGIIQSLEYIRNLGMNAIWLTPVFDSHAGAPQHRLDGSKAVDLKLDATGYYTRDYFSIDPKFGTLEDARELVDTAHGLGLYVFFDGVFGHHKGELVASPSGALPVDSTDPGDYGGNPSGYPGRVVDFSAPESLAFYREVATYWINELGIDGWRLDQAYQVPPEAWRRIRDAVEDAAGARRQAGEQWGTLGYMVAEIFSGADDIAAQAFGPEDQPILNSAFDFPLRWATVGVLAAEENGLSGRPASTINEGWAYGAHNNIYPAHALPNMMLGNHDFVRFGDLLQRAGIAQPEDDAWWARHRLAFMVQAAYTGPLTRYYGEELGDEVPGFSQPVGTGCAALGLCDDHVARSSGKVPGISVDEGDLRAEQLELLQFHATLMQARSHYPALARGSRQHLYSDHSLYADLKSHGSQQIVFAMNAGSAAQDVRISTRLFSSTPTAAWDILGDQPVTVADGYLAFTLPPFSGRYILLDAEPLTPLQINAGMNDAWYDPATNGQGFFTSVFPDIGLVFLSWFTYELERPPQDTPANLGEAGHRWLTAQGRLNGNHAHLQVFRSSGGVFNTGQPAPGVTAVGWIELEFRNCREARLLYDIDPPGVSGEILLQRVATDNIALCEALGSR